MIRGKNNFVYVLFGLMYMYYVNSDLFDLGGGKVKIFFYYELFDF